MSQHDLTIANQTAANARADINNALQALGSTSSGTTGPSTPYANQLFYSTGDNILRIRNEANDDWIAIGYFDQGVNSFRILDNTQVTNASGVQTGLIGGQSTSVWQAGTGTDKSLVSPANVKAVIDSTLPFTTGSGTAQIGTLKMAWGKHSAVAGGSVTITLPFSYTSTSSFGVVAISDNGNHGGATRAAQGVSITAVNQIVYSKAAFSGSFVHWHTIGY